MDKKIKIWHIILLIVILVFIFFLIRAFRVGGCSPTDAPINDTIVKSDTIYISKIDTIKVYYPKYIEVSTKDTIYISRDTTLEVKSKMYSEKDKYDVWISGIEPLALDSINVYREVKYETITNTITRNRYINERQLFLGGGIDVWGSKIYPKFGVSYKDKKDRLYSLDFSHIDGKNMFSGTIKFAIN